MPVNAVKVVAGLSTALADIDLDPGSLAPRLQQVVDAAAGTFDVAGAGLMLLDEGGVLREVAGSSAAGRALEDAQVALGLGPAMDSTAEHRFVAAEDLETDERWPGLWELLATHEVHAVASAPVSVRGRPAGNLCLLRTEPYSWTERDAQALTAFAGVVTALLRIAIETRAQDETVSALRVVMESDRKPSTGGS